MSSSRIKTYKLVLVGDPGVGKTSIRKRYLGEGFKANHSMTIGADFGIKKVKTTDDSYIFQIWDLSGQLSFKSVRKMYYKNVSALLIIFDMTDPESLLNVKLWVDEYIQLGFDLNINIILIGNKEDLIFDVPVEQIQEIEVQRDYIESQLKQEVEFIVTSALSGFNVEIAFMWLIDQIVKNPK